MRWDRLCQIRREKFDYILPEAMRENGIDMWMVAMKEGHYDPQWDLLGRGYVGSIGFASLQIGAPIASSVRR